ncbi:ATPase [Clostridia bacterium]|nr:ATPase [Clostridia bacterium]
MAKKIEATINPALLNVIAPQGLEFQRGGLSVGENEARLYGIVKYPQIVDYGWLSDVTNMDGTVVSVTFTPMDNASFIESLSRGISLSRGEMLSAKDPLAQQRAEAAAEDGARIMASVDRNGETVGLVSVIAMPTSRNGIESICRELESSVAVLGGKVRVLANLQPDAFKQLTPFYTTRENVEAVTQRVMPMSTFIGGFPFASSGYNDGTGICIGQDGVGGLVIVDTWKRGGDRVNSNFVIMGGSGGGKSTAIKNVALLECARGTRVIFIDPEREYKTLTEKLGGDWINAAGGALVNPLQVRPAPVGDDETSVNDMARHMGTLETFFSLYLPDLTDLQRAALKDSLITLYKKKCITWDTDISKLAPEDFPIFSELYDEVSDPTLAALLKDIAYGADSFIWNGYTSVNPKGNCICLDTHELESMPPRVKKTQYFNLLSLCWEICSRDKNERVLLVCDEAYLMIDAKVPQSLEFLCNLMKRARKYSTGVAIISHNAADFLDLSVKKYGQPLLDLPCYKLLFGSDGQNLKETAELYRLTDAEQGLLLARQRGCALFMVGSKRLKVNIDIPQWKFTEFFGTGGGT